MNDKIDSVASAQEQAATARNGFEGHHPTPESETGPDGPEKGIGGDTASGMGRMQTAYFVEADVDAAKLDTVTVNGVAFLPAAEVEGFERFDITKRKSLDGDAALAIDVLHLYRRGGSFTPGDATRIVDTIGRLRAAVRHEREHAGKSEAGRRVAEDRLANMTTNRDALAEECFNLNLRDEASTSTVQAMASRVADLTVERDAAAENARRERDRRGTYDAEMLRAGAVALYQAATGLGVDRLYQVGPQHAAVRKTFVESILRAVGLVTEREEKPLVRVVTSPRFYSEEDRQRAVKAYLHDRYGCAGDVIDTVAAALGMRRA